MKKSIVLFMIAFISATTFGQTNQKKGIAIQGYDPVAYFESAKAIEGKKEITENTTM
jgi:hypothetical protein